MKISIRREYFFLPIIFLLILLVCETVHAQEDPQETLESLGDMDNKESKLVLKKGDFVAVPIPISDPTLGTGLVVGGAYFYAQTEEQKKSQPASMTGVAGIYTNNGSFAYGIAQQNYWTEDKWRFNGVLAHGDFEFALLDPANTDKTFDWFIKGDFLQLALSRRIFSDWYIGVQGRYVDITQKFELDFDEIDFEIDTDIASVGLGATLEFDTRDVPTNPFSGRHFEVDVLLNGSMAGGDNTYQTYEASYRSYHQISKPLVVAWEVRGCKKSGTVPLWDGCMVGLRGFAATDYLGVGSLSGQVEARWRFWKKLGAVGFAGYGTNRSTYSEEGGNISIPSYGIGLRFMVLESKRINMRLDYSRSKDSDAVYLSVGEAF